MLRFLVQRLALAIPTLVIASMIIFTLQQLLPGDTATALSGEERDPEVIAFIRQKYHLDQPLPVRYVLWAGGVLDPVAHLGLRANGAGAWFGWPDSPRLEALRQDWMAAADADAQKRIAEAIQVQFWQDVPYAPLGQYFRVMAHHRGLTDIPVGLSTFTGVRRA